MTEDKNQDQLDKNTIGRRARRYTRVTTTAGGLAAKLAGQKYLGLDFNREDHAKKLMMSLGELKGPLLKLVQLLSTIPEALPREYAQELQKLQSDAPAMGWLFVKRRMAAELGRDWQKKFDVFGKEASAAASLGQVHRATLPDGRDVACKLQYPDMGSAVEGDLKQLKLVFKAFEAYDKSIETEHIFEELAERLYEELDYKREAKATQLYADLLKTEKHVHVPELVTEYSTDRLLTTTWHDGRKALEFVDAPQEQRDRIALNLFRAWYTPLYGYGVIHGDPHPGNYLVDEKDDIHLLDYGCIRVFPPTFIKGVIDLYHALLRDEKDLAVAAFEAWGFDNMSDELIDVLMVWARFLYGPVLEDKKRVIGEVKGEVYGRDIAKKVHHELRRLGGVKVPREFVFMDRAALGLGSVFLHLRSQVNWYQLFHELTGDFDCEKLAKKQQDMLKKHDLLDGF